MTKTFDWCPKPNVVQVIEQGQERTDLTRGCIAKGKKLGALEKIAAEPPPGSEPSG